MQKLGELEDLHVCFWVSCVPPDGARYIIPEILWYYIRNWRAGARGGFIRV